MNKYFSNSLAQSVNTLKSSFVLPKGYLVLKDTYSALKVINEQVNRYQDIINIVVNHKLELDSLKNISIKGDNNELTDEDRSIWCSKFNPKIIQFTGFYNKSFELLKTSIDSKHFNLVLQLNESITKHSEFSIKSLEIQITAFDVEGGKKAYCNLFLQILTHFTDILEVRSEILYSEIMKNNSLNKQATLNMHKNISEFDESIHPLKQSYADSDIPMSDDMTYMISELDKLKNLYQYRK